MTEFAIVGSGFRADAFLRVAAALPDRFRVTAVLARRDEARERIQHTWGVPAFRTFDEMRAKAAQPGFVVVAVSSAALASVTSEVAQHGYPILVETPPAADIDGLNELFGLVQNGARIQVAEQYHLEPLLAAQITVAKSGRLGDVTQANVSVAHDYHGMSLIRAFLSAGFEDATISAWRFRSNIIAGPGREGDPARERETEETRTMAVLEFDGTLGIYDFSNDQYRSWIRTPSVVIRGDRGELRDLELRYLHDYRTPTEAVLRRVVAGGAGNHEGMFLRGITGMGEWLFLNDFMPARLADEELAMAAMLQGMAAYVSEGKDIYSLPDAAQDQYLALLVQRSLETGEPVRTEPQHWAQ